MPGFSQLAPTGLALGTPCIRQQSHTPTLQTNSLFTSLEEAGGDYEGRGREVLAGDFRRLRGRHALAHGEDTADGDADEASVFDLAEAEHVVRGLRHELAQKVGELGKPVGPNVP